MTKKSITKREYAAPYIRLREISVEPFLANTETLPFDREEETGDALWRLPSREVSSPWAVTARALWDSISIMVP